MASILPQDQHLGRTYLCQYLENEHFAVLAKEILFLTCHTKLAWPIYETSRKPRPTLRRQKVNSCLKYLEETKLKACLCFVFLMVNTESQSWKQKEINIYSLVVEILSMRRNKIKADFLCRTHFNLAQICVFQVRQFCLILLRLCSFLIPVSRSESPIGSEQTLQLYGEKMLGSCSSNPFFG